MLAGKYLIHTIAEYFGFSSPLLGVLIVYAMVWLGNRTHDGNFAAGEGDGNTAGGSYADIHSHKSSHWTGAY